MEAGCRVKRCLPVTVPSVSSNAYRPPDTGSSLKGLTFGDCPV